MLKRKVRTRNLCGEFLRPEQLRGPSSKLRGESYTLSRSDSDNSQDDRRVWLWQASDTGPCHVCLYSVTYNAVLNETPLLKVGIRVHSICRFYLKILMLWGFPKDNSHRQREWENLKYVCGIKILGKLRTPRNVPAHDNQKTLQE